MLYRDCPDLTPPDDADLDTDEMVEVAGAVERGERRLAVLARLTEIGLRLAEALGRQAEATIEATTAAMTAATTGDSNHPKPGGDQTTAFDKIAQTIRRTVALAEKLDKDVGTRREGLAVQRSTRRAKLNAAHETAMNEAIIYGFHDAYAASRPEAHRSDDNEFENLMEDAEEYLGDADEMRGYLDRPVGETVARLCAHMGLEPDACTLKDGTWKVRRPPSEFELCRDKILDELTRPAPIPSEEGHTAPPSGWGTVDEIPNTC